MDQIAEEVDIARKTIYNHFPVKEAIVSEYVKREIQDQGFEMVRLVQELPDTRMRLIEIFSKTFKWAELNKEIFKVYVSYQMRIIFQDIPGSRSKFRELLAYIIRLGQESGEIRQDIPVEVLVNHADFIRATTTLGWLSNQEQYPLQESIAMNVDLFISGAQKKNVIE